MIRDTIPPPTRRKPGRPTNLESDRAMMRIRECYLLRCQGLTKRQAAEFLGVSVATVSRWTVQARRWYQREPEHAR